jgi:hypothetical protein
MVRLADLAKASDYADHLIQVIAHHEACRRVALIGEKLFEESNWAVVDYK